MVVFSRSIDIAAPPGRVWQVMSDVERWHEWTASVTSITLRDAGPLRVGTRAVIRQPKFPPAHWRVTTIEPGSGFTWVNRAPGIYVQAHHSVEATTGGTRATLTLQYQGLFGRLLASLTRGITERYLDMEAAGLKQRSEDPESRHDGRS